MADMRAVLDRGHQAAPGRGVLVAADLAALAGPVSGPAELPLWVFAHPQRTFSLDDPEERAWLYENVLREARRAADLAVLDRDTLVALWPGLNLPAGVRQAWEQRHAQLRASTRCTAT
jgi:hypothetical protein